MSTDRTRPARPGGRRTRGLEVWLKHEHLPQEERINRLAVDAELVVDLRRAGFRGREWDFLSRVLAEYGIGVIGGWMRRGVIGEELARKKVRAPALPQHAMDDHHVRDEVAVMTVGDALRVFQTDVLPNGKWRPDRGAALSTYFITQCLFRYGNAVQQWLRDNEVATEAARGLQVTATDPHLLDDMASRQRGRVSTSNVEDDVVRDQAARIAVNSASTPRAARARALDLLGYSDTEIARDLGTSRKAISSLLERERARSQAAAQREPTQDGPA